MLQIVELADNQVVTSSLQIAESFGKQHRHVLDAIDELKEGLAENWADLFYESSYVHEQNKQRYRMYLMNRDGFTLLAMGFTGKDALKWKLKYIAAFNEMEKSIQLSLTMPTNMVEALTLALEQAKTIEEQRPKVELYDQAMSSENLLTMEEVAKTLNINGIGRNKLFALLRSKGILERQNLPYQQYVDRGYFKTVMKPYMRNGVEYHSIQTVVTAKGLEFINKLVLGKLKENKNE